MAQFSPHQHVQHVRVQRIGGVVDISVHAGLVNELAGPCAAGKTSFLRAMQMALGGIRAYTKSGKGDNSLVARSAKPIRRGEEEGEIEIETDDFLIKLVLKEEGAPYLRIKGKHGGTFNRSDLAQMLSVLTFDPTEFATWDEKKQLGVFRDLAGEAWCQQLDVIDAEEARLVKERYNLGRDLDALGEPDEEPEKAEKPDTAALMRQLAEVQAFNRAQEDQRQKRLRMAGECTAIQDEIEELEAEYKRRLADAQRRLVDAEARFQNEPSDQPRKDTSPIEDQIAQASEVGAQAVMWERWREKEDRRAEKQTTYKTVETAVLHARQQRTEHMANARLPVAGISFAEGKILVNGLPLTELSGGEMIDLCADVMMAMNPEMRVMFVQRGEQLDQAMYDRLVAKAESVKPPIQLWIATVSDSGEGHGDAIHIYAGRLVEAA